MVNGVTLKEDGRRHCEGVGKGDKPVDRYDTPRGFVFLHLLKSDPNRGAKFDLAKAKAKTNGFQARSNLD